MFGKADHYGEPLPERSWLELGAAAPGSTACFTSSQVTDEGAVLTTLALITLAEIPAYSLSLETKLIPFLPQHLEVSSGLGSFLRLEERCKNNFKIVNLG